MISIPSLISCAFDFQQAVPTNREMTGTLFVSPTILEGKIRPTVCPPKKSRPLNSRIMLATGGPPGPTVITPPMPDHSPSRQSIMSWPVCGSWKKASSSTPTKRVSHRLGRSHSIRDVHVKFFFFTSNSTLPWASIPMTVLRHENNLFSN